MKEDTKKLFSVLFDPGEEVCATKNKYAANSTKQEDVDDENSQFIAINPIKGWREDSKVTAFRSFLVELDDRPIRDQHEYIKESKIPYSACVFSGNKSLHYAITMDKPLTDMRSYKYVACWIRNILKDADQNNINPSRNLRYPGFLRDTGKLQKLVEIRERVSREELHRWLHRRPDCRPVIEVVKPISATPNPKLLSKWVLKDLKNGIDTTSGRNNRWFSIAYDFGMAGFDVDYTINYLSQHFEPEIDFGIQEWESCIRHAYSSIGQKLKTSKN